jgi:23S rRNA (uridine2552-2'-O)-methyltransferase
LLRRLPGLRPGATVVELGCWPGGWLQVLAEQVGPGGRVLGLDLEAIDPLPPPVETLQLDFTDDGAPERIAEALGRPADALFCDAAPKLSGVRDLDRAALEELGDAALAVAERVLRPGGAIVIKGFPGPEADRFRARLRERFGRVREVRPEGRRATSREFYWVTPGDLGAAGASPRSSGRADSRPSGGRRHGRTRPRGRP